MEEKKLFIVEQFSLGWDGKTKRIHGYVLCDSKDTALLLALQTLTKFENDGYLIEEILVEEFWKISNNPKKIQRKLEDFIRIYEPNVVSLKDIKIEPLGV